MQSRPYVYDYDNEPADERPTGFGETNFGHSGIAALSTTAAAWTVSQHSTFDEPSRAAHRVQAYRRHGAHRRAGLIGVALLAVAVVAAALALALHS